MANPTVLLGALLGFGFVATDVFSAASLHLFSEPDLATNRWVVGHIPPEAMDWFFEKFVSYAPGVAVLTVWNLLGSKDSGASASIDDGPHTGANGNRPWMDSEPNINGDTDFVANAGEAGLEGPPPQTTSRRTKAWKPSNALFFLFGSGTTILMLALKEVFQRRRPGTEMLTLSFPSGHATLTVLFVGMLIFVWIPLVWDASCGANSQGGGEGTHDGIVHATAEFRFVEYLRAHSWSTLMAFWGVVGVGRICADAHWVSDNIAGGCLGLFCASVMANYCLHKQS